MSGRTAASRDRLPALHRVEIETNAGEIIEARIPDDGAKPSVVLHHLRSSGPVLFDRCPICLEDKPTSKEHVPPQKVGGGVMTRTCSTCNNLFGQKYEGELLRWWDYSFNRYSVTHPDLQGKRTLKNVMLRETLEGEPVVFFDLDQDSDVWQAMRSDTPFSSEFSPPDPDLWRVAALKSAFLAACILRGEVVENDEGRRVREYLLAARDAPKNKPPAIPFDFHVARNNAEATPGLVELVRVESEEKTYTEFAVLLSGVLLVSWCFGGWLHVELGDGQKYVMPLDRETEQSVQ